LEPYHISEESSLVGANTVTAAVVVKDRSEESVGNNVLIYKVQTWQKIWTDEAD